MDLSHSSWSRSENNGFKLQLRSRWCEPENFYTVDNCGKIGPQLRSWCNCGVSKYLEAATAIVVAGHNLKPWLKLKEEEEEEGPASKQNLDVGLFILVLTVGAPIGTPWIGTAPFRARRQERWRRSRHARPNFLVRLVRRQWHHFRLLQITTSANIKWTPQLKKKSVTIKSLKQNRS